LARFNSLARFKIQTSVSIGALQLAAETNLCCQLSPTRPAQACCFRFSRNDWYFMGPSQLSLGRTGFLSYFFRHRATLLEIKSFPYRPDQHPNATTAIPFEVR